MEDAPPLTLIQTINHELEELATYFVCEYYKIVGLHVLFFL